MRDINVRKFDAGGDHMRDRALWMRNELQGHIYRCLVLEYNKNEQAQLLSLEKSRRGLIATTAIS